MEARLLQDEFHWVPMHERGLPPRKPDNRTPLLWVVRRSSDSPGPGSELFLVNDTGETLDSVTTYKTGFTTADDDVLVIVDEEGLTYR